jgi:hypothetical protein
MHLPGPKPRAEHLLRPQEEAMPLPTTPPDLRKALMASPTDAM